MLASFIFIHIQDEPTVLTCGLAVVESLIRHAEIASILAPWLFCKGKSYTCKHSDTVVRMPFCTAVYVYVYFGRKQSQRRSWDHAESM